MLVHQRVVVINKGFIKLEGDGIIAAHSPEKMVFEENHLKRGVDFRGCHMIFPYFLSTAILCLWVVATHIFCFLFLGSDGFPT